MVGYFVPFDLTVNITSSVIETGTSPSCSGYYLEPVAVRPSGAGFEALARRERIAAQPRHHRRERPAIHPLLNTIRRGMAWTLG